MFWNCYCAWQHQINQHSVMHLKWVKSLKTAPTIITTTARTYLHIDKGTDRQTKSPSNTNVNNHLTKGESECAFGKSVCHTFLLCQQWHMYAKMPVLFSCTHFGKYPTVNNNPSNIASIAMLIYCYENGKILKLVF